MSWIVSAVVIIVHNAWKVSKYWVFSALSFLVLGMNTFIYNVNASIYSKFSIKDFFSKCDQIRRKLPIWSHLLKKSLMENFIFCTVIQTITLDLVIFHAVLDTCLIYFVPILHLELRFCVFLKKRYIRYTSLPKYILTYKIYGYKERTHKVKDT